MNPEVDRTFDIDVDKLVQRDKEEYKEHMEKTNDPLSYYEGVGGR